MFGINGWEFVVLAVVALVVIGPDKLPGFIQDAGRMIRQVRKMATEAQADVRDHLGPEFAELDLSDLNPRAFVQKHLLDDALDDDLRDSVRVSLDDDDPPKRASTGSTALNFAKDETPAPAAPEGNAYADGDIT